MSDEQAEFDAAGVAFTEACQEAGLIYRDALDAGVPQFEALEAFFADPKVKDAADVWDAFTSEWALRLMDAA